MSAQLQKPRRFTDPNLFHQVRPLEVKLAARDGNSAGPASADDLRSVERISATFRLSVDNPEVIHDRRDRLPAAPEPFQLRMVPVSLRLAAEDLLRQQAFAPDGHQAARIQE
jgi:hypothetical protein